MILAVITGVFSGIISGMGIGGGTILIPVLTIFLNVNQHAAQGVNLLYFIPTALIALCVHFKNKTVDLKTAVPIIVSGVLGAVGGSLLANYFSADILRKCFAVFLFIMGIYELLKKDREVKS